MRRNTLYCQQAELPCFAQADPHDDIIGYPCHVMSFLILPYLEEISLQTLHTSKRRGKLAAEVNTQMHACIKELAVYSVTDSA
jgi:hypothetical protein